MHFLYLFIVFTSPLTVFAGLSKDQCGSYDYSARFGPIRDQDGHGYCFAFTASALIEEHLCKKNPQYCGMNISPIDISRCGWSLMQDQEGGSITEALKCAINNGGVCFEDFAPYNALTDLGCSLWDVAFGDGTKCKNQKIAALYTKWKNSCNPFDKTSENLSSLFELQKSLVKSLREKVPEQFLAGKDAISLFNNSASASQFLKNILISESCAKNRNKINAEIKRMDIPDNAPSFKQNQMIRFIAEGLRKNSSVAISLDLGKTGRHMYSLNSMHGLVVTGMKYNEFADRCEFQLRNSYGEGAEFNGWYPVDDLEKAIVNGRYLSEY